MVTVTIIGENASSEQSLEITIPREKYSSVHVRKVTLCGINGGWNGYCLWFLKFNATGATSSLDRWLTNDRVMVGGDFSGEVTINRSSPGYSLVIGPQSDPTMAWFAVVNISTSTECPTPIILSSRTHTVPFKIPLSTHLQGGYCPGDGKIEEIHDFTTQDQGDSWVLEFKAPTFVTGISVLVDNTPSRYTVQYTPIVCGSAPWKAYKPPEYQPSEDYFCSGDGQNCSLSILKVQCVNLTFNVTVMQPNISVYGLGDCEDGWVRYNQSCYMFDKTAGNITQAQAICTAYGGYLTSIGSENENAFLAHHLGSPTVTEDWWIGLTDEQMEGSHRWTDSGTISTYTNWNHGEPNGNGGSSLDPDEEDCVMLRTDNHTWIDVACNSSFPFVICEKDYLNYVRTPLLIIQGETDTVVPTTSSADTSSAAVTYITPTTSTTPMTTNAWPSTVGSTTTMATTGGPSTIGSTTGTNLCQCDCMEENSTITEARLQRLMEDIRKDMAINISELSSTRRKLESARDERSTAAGLGYAGVVIIVIYLGILVCLDANILVRDFRKVIGNISGKIYANDQRDYELEQTGEK